jgi:creatinine amidohydrolase
MESHVTKARLYSVHGPKMLEEMSWPEVQDALKNTDIALPVVGAIEQHGPHSPLMSDCIQGTEVAKRACQMLSEEGIKVVVGPLIPFGYSPHHMGFPGTITLRTTTFHELLKDVFRSLIHHGFRKLVVISGHGGNKPSIYLAVNEIYEETKVRIVAAEWSPTLHKTYLKLAHSDYPKGDFHQGERATSLTLAACPELVDMSKAVTYYSKEWERRDNLYGAGVNLPYLIDYDMRAVTEVGHIGNAAVATKELGEAEYEASARYIADLVKNEFVAGKSA